MRFESASAFMLDDTGAISVSELVEQSGLSEAEVRGADEVWVTSSSKEVLAIVRLDGSPIGDGRPGPMFRRMYRLYQDFKQRVMRAGARESVSASA